MSRQATKHVAFLRKAPTSRHDLLWILQIADRLIDRHDGEPEPTPANVIPFPGTQRDGRLSSLE